MNISNLEIIQASIELFAALVCLLGVVLIVFNKSQKKSMKYFVYFLLIGFFLFVSESLAYIFRGNTDYFSVTITRLSNFTVFTLNVVLFMVFVRYFASLCSNEGIKPHKAFRYLVDLLSAIVFIFLIINLFIEKMYYFDSDNYYVRGPLYFIYIALCLSLAGILLVEIIKYFKPLGIETGVSNILFVAMPFIATVIQSFYYGISITNIGIGLSFVLMLIVYLREWAKKENDKEAAEKKTNKAETLIFFLIMSLFMGASILSCVLSITRISKESSEKSSLTIAQMVSNGIENQMIESIAVSNTMAADNELRNILIESKTTGPLSIEDRARDYLISISNNFGYQQSFIVYDETKAYYTRNGLQKIMNPEADSHDVWYSNFMASGKDYELNVDTDEGNSHKKTIFINKCIKDTDGTVIGAIGVGLSFEYVENIVKKYESDYDISVILLNTSGNIELMSKELDVNPNSYIGRNNDQFDYKHEDDHATLVRYDSLLDWYMVVIDNNPDKINIAEIVVPSVLIYLAGVLVLALVFGYITAHQTRTYRHMIEKKNEALTDEMTGLLNRRAYDDELLLIKDELYQYAVVMIDLNGLKFVNDNLGHEAGDELISSFGALLLNVFSNKSKCFRTGGDEFVVLTRYLDDRLVEAIETLDHLCYKHKGTFINEISYSYGIEHFKNHMDISVEEVIHLADEAMYKYKDEYYKKTGKERRK